MSLTVKIVLAEIAGLMAMAAYADMKPDSSESWGWWISSILVAVAAGMIFVEVGRVKERHNR